MCSSGSYETTDILWEDRFDSHVGPPFQMSASKGYRVIAPDRYLRVQPLEARVTVRLGAATVADSEAALELSEGDRAPVIYVPKRDLAASLVPSPRTSHCRWKGDAIYHDEWLADESVKDGVSEYASPPPEIERLAGHVAVEANAFEMEVTP